MSTLELARKLVEYCKAGQNFDAINELYADDIVSREPCAMDDMPQAMEGKEAILAKTRWFFENNEVHSGEVFGPYPSDDDRFAVFFRMEVTPKQVGQKITIEEVGVYTVKDGKVTHEEFFYDMNG